MKASMALIMLLALTTFVMVGCSDNSSPVAGPASQITPAASTPAALGKSENEIQSVTGTGHWKSFPFSPQTKVRISFSAVRHADGHVSGEVQDRDAGPTFNFHGKVVDLKIEGNMARIEFIFTRGSFMGAPLADYYGGDLSGVRAWLVAIDNGNGRNATGKDVVTGVLWGNDAELQFVLGVDVEYISSLGVAEFMTYMTTVVLPTIGVPPEAFLTEVENGNVNVK